jgi:hypothetical protein
VPLEKAIHRAVHGGHHTIAKQPLARCPPSERLRSLWTIPPEMSTAARLQRMFPWEGVQGGDNRCSQFYGDHPKDNFQHHGKSAVLNAVLNSALVRRMSPKSLNCLARSERFELPTLRFVVWMP